MILRQWLGDEQASSYCLKQYWPSSPTHIYVALGEDKEFYPMYMINSAIGKMVSIVRTDKQ